MRRLLENFTVNRKGIPDLFLVKEETPLFVEVKSKKERVAVHQTEWMLFLRQEVGVAIEICRVAPRFSANSRSDGTDFYLETN